MARTRPIRVCQLTPCLWSGGTEERIASVLSAMDRQAFELSWMGFGPVREALIDKAGPNIAVRPFNRNVLGGIEPGLILQIAAELRRLKPDVMHIHNWSTSLYGIAAARLARVPVVIYGVGGRATMDPPPPRRQKVMRTLAPHVDRFTAVCGWLADHVANNWLVPRDRVDVLRTGIDLATIDHGPERQAVRSRLQIAGDGPIVGAISVVRPVKRIQDLIEAMGLLASRHENAHLVIAGNPLGVSLDELRLRAAEHGISSRVHLLGRVEIPEALLPAIDVFVNCSVFEGTSNAILEAMAARIPVVATAVGGTPELIDDGVEGRLVPPEAPAALAQAINDFLDSPERRAAAGDAGRRRIEARHTSQQMIDAYLGLYRRTTADAVRRGGSRTMAASLASLRRAF